MKLRAFYLGLIWPEDKTLAWEAKTPFSEEAQNKLHSVFFLFSLLTHAAIYVAVWTLLDSQGFTVGNHRSEGASGKVRVAEETYSTEAYTNYPGIVSLVTQQ